MSALGTINRKQRFSRFVFLFQIEKINNLPTFNLNFNITKLIHFSYYSHTTKTTQWEDPRIQFRQQQQRAMSDRKPAGTLIHVII